VEDPLPRSIPSPWFDPESGQKKIGSKTDHTSNVSTSDWNRRDNEEERGRRLVIDTKEEKVTE
jgi:hypothetical protein